MFLTIGNRFIATGKLVWKKEDDKQYWWWHKMSDQQKLEYLRQVKKKAQEKGMVAPNIDAYIASYELICEDMKIGDDREEEFA